LHDSGRTISPWLSPDQIRERDLFPRGFLPLLYPNHAEGGRVFPHFEIEEVKKQEGRDLTRFDLDFDFPDHLLPEFPAPIYLTTRPDLRDVSQGQLVRIENYYRLFNGILLLRLRVNNLVWPKV
jgi:cytochrome c peroxidase